MRIALFASAFAPAVGGVEELTSRLAAHLTQAGDTVEIWTHRHPANLPVGETIDGADVKRFTLPLPSMTIRGVARFVVGGPRALLHLVRAARRFRPDVVHVQCFSVNGAYATALSVITGVPLVTSLQGETVMDDADIFDRSHSLRAALRLGLRRSAAVTACSQFVLEDAQRFGLAPGSGQVVPNGVDLDDLNPPVPVAVPFGRFIFAVGRMVEKKGFDLLVTAFARVAADHPDIGLVIGGDGRARAGLERLVNDLGLTAQTWLPGVLSRDEVAWTMHHAEIFVLPSRVEPFGIVVLEALRAGRPVIVTNRGGAGEIVRHGQDGLVVDPRDQVELARAISRLLGNPKLRTQLSAAATTRAAEFSWKAISEDYRTVYREVGGPPSRAVRQSRQ